MLRREGGGRKAATQALLVIAECIRASRGRRARGEPAATKDPQREGVNPREVKVAKAKKNATEQGIPQKIEDPSSNKENVQPLQQDLAILIGNEIDEAKIKCKKQYSR